MASRFRNSLGRPFCIWCVYTVCGCVIAQIRGALASLEGLQQPVDVRIIRDHITSASRGFCFLEFSSGEVGLVTWDYLYSYVMSDVCCLQYWASKVSLPSCLNVVFFIPTSVTRQHCTYTIMLYVILSMLKNLNWSFRSPKMHCTMWLWNLREFHGGTTVLGLLIDSGNYEVNKLSSVCIVHHSSKLLHYVLYLHCVYR